MAVALTPLTRKAQRAARLAAEADQATNERDALALKAFTQGASYQDLADAMGVSRERVKQVLSRQRKRAVT